ncbi:hypothetical protein [Streptomyces sp. NPDC002566]|uniref:hypothetical protein n=1 Tax=Streptomyces sp. NPDC002566 TaxID=3364650 RepID=UPI00368626F1
MAGSLVHVVAGVSLVWLGRDLSGPALAALGLALGLVGWPEAACGVAVAGVLLGSGPEPLAWAALPVLVGYGIRLSHLLPERWRSPEAALVRISRFGPYIRPLLPVDRFWAGAMLLTVIAPMVAVAGQDRGGLVLVACAAALATQMTLLDKAVEHEHRWGVRSHRIIMTFGNAVAALSAAGPAGGWFVSRWSQSGLLTGWLGGALICGVVSVARLVRPGRLRAMTVLWLFPFWAVAVFHPAPGTAVALLPLLLAETAVVCCVDRPAPGRIVDRFTAFMIQEESERRMSFLGPWLYDGFLRSPGTTDFRLVRRYLGMAVHAARGGFVPGQSSIVNKDPVLRQPLTGLAALRWTALATQALTLVDEEVTPRVPAETRQSLARARSTVEAELVLAKALVLTFAEAWDDALRGWREATLRYKALGLRAEEAACRAATADVLERGLGRCEDARRERARIPSDLPEPAWDSLDDRVRDGLSALSADRQHQTDRSRVEAA